jgi:hypothetical protein
MQRPGALEPQPTGAELVAAVAERELLRLFGMPRGRRLEGELRERVDRARAWYAAHGRPFSTSRRVPLAGLEADEVALEGGVTLRCRSLAESLRSAGARAVAVLAVSAGREVAAEVKALWARECPDEAYVLDRLAAAVAEALVLRASGSSCRDASRAGETLLRVHAPGCSDFDLADQQRLMAVLGAIPGAEGRVALGAIELLPTGALDPPQSLLAAAGLTRERLPAASPEDLCRGCALDPCGFRRAPFASRAGVRAPMLD